MLSLSSARGRRARDRGQEALTHGLGRRLRRAWRSNTGSPLEVLRVFLKLGLTSFGGPVAHLGYFRREFVVSAAAGSTSAPMPMWLALSQFLPGPATSQTGFAHRALSRRVSWRPCCMGGLHPALGGGRCRCSPTGEGALTGPVGDRRDPWPQTGRGRHCRPGASGNDAAASARPAAHDHSRSAALILTVFAPTPSAQILTIRRGALAGFLPAGASATGAAPLVSPSPAAWRLPSPDPVCRPARNRTTLLQHRRRRRCSAPSTAPEHWCSAAAMSCCRFSTTRWCGRAGSHRPAFSPAMAQPRPCPARFSPSPPIWARRERVTERRARRDPGPGGDLPAGPVAADGGPGLLAALASAQRCARRDGRRQCGRGRSARFGAL